MRRIHDDDGRLQGSPTQPAGPLVHRERKPDEAPSAPLAIGRTWPFVTERVGVILTACLLLILSGCGREDVRYFQVPKVTGSDEAPSTIMPVAAGHESVIRWNVPATWRVLPADGLRLASFSIAGSGSNQAGDVSIVTFSGSGGDDLANVNRWRGQLQLAPLPAASLARCLSSIQTTAGRALVVELDGTSPDNGEKRRIVGAWLRSPDRVWFIKVSGSTPLVESQQQVFYDFVKTLHFDPLEVGGRGLQHDALPVAAHGITDSVSWVSPPAWKEGPPTAMRKATFDLGSGVEVSVSTFPGDVGGLLANVNRWRAQVGVGPLSEDEMTRSLTHIVVPGGQLSVIAAGPAVGGGKAIVAATFETPNQTWFFKLTGDDASVVRARPQFDEFLATIAAH